MSSLVWRQLISSFQNVFYVEHIVVFVERITPLARLIIKTEDHLFRDFALNGKSQQSAKRISAISFYRLTSTRI
jgi:hypothetical protein